ncbi:TerC family protein [Lyngbya confervoides]|uniref:TerC family protein n=1 Tax=Lyngbya confervoides BDU141951 TaxID=1574623 RepID=A0ABD4T4M7_9CYAN|nr:TerC family protein [Lyngbya confervoides]MCM1983423.1 TerC family protein [Lyngbya confervoides BDU141951]
MFDQLNQLVEQHSQLGVHTAVILVVLVSLEAVLSADNAIALAALVQGLGNVELERKALNIGLVAAFVMRMALILTATWVIRFWQFELLGALYLLWLAGKYFFSDEGEAHEHHGPRFSSLWQAIPLIAITDLAFSLDSVTTAIALADDRWLVVTGGVIGILTLRFLAELFITWLQEYTHLQDAGYITVSLVGGRLLLKVINDRWVPPEWLMIVLIALTFAWGFSKRRVVETDPGSPESDSASDLEETVTLVPESVDHVSSKPTVKSS